MSNGIGNKVKICNMTLLNTYREELCEKPKLEYLFFELTDSCNLSCLHCGSNSSRCNKNELPYELIDKVLEEVAKRYKPYTIMICLTGGEPLLYKNVFTLIRRIRQLGFMCGMTTNATLIDANVATKLKNFGLQSVSISLDGLENEHNALRNDSAAFEKAVCGIKELVSLGGIKTQITTVVSKINIGYLEQIFELAEELKVDSWRPINIEPIGRARNHSDLLLGNDELKYLIDFIIHKRFDSNTEMEVTYGCSHYLTLEYERMTRDNYFSCRAGLSVASVLVNGDIYACLDIERRPELIQGNIITDSFTAVWENKFDFFRHDRANLCVECVNCPDNMYCHGDSAHTWDYDNNRPMLCFKKILI